MPNKTTVVFPSYQPGRELHLLACELLLRGFEVLIVDDGSAPPIDAPTGAELLRHEENLGKGAALKTAFRHILRKNEDVCAIVTADADGQHRLDDIVRIAEETLLQSDSMVLGVRQFDNPEIPFRSRFGNLWTRSEFRILTGRKISDTQSGLRGFPRKMLSELLEIPGERYEYEIGVLVTMARQGRVVEMPIGTVYQPGNPTSHYRPWKDTLLTQAALFKAAFRRPADNKGSVSGVLDLA